MSCRRRRRVGRPAGDAIVRKQLAEPSRCSHPSSARTLLCLRLASRYRLSAVDALNLSAIVATDIWLQESERPAAHAARVAGGRIPGAKLGAALGGKPFFPWVGICRRWRAGPVHGSSSGRAVSAAAGRSAAAWRVAAGRVAHRCVAAVRWCHRVLQSGACVAGGQHDGRGVAYAPAVTLPVAGMPTSCAPRSSGTGASRRFVCNQALCVISGMWTATRD